MVNATRKPRARPDLRPLTRLRLTKLWPNARRQGRAIGQAYIVNYYCKHCGPDVVYLFDPRHPNSLWTADAPFVRKHFEIVEESRERSVYGKGRPLLRDLYATGAGAR